MQWDDIPAVRRRWHTFGGPETRFAEHAARRWLSGRSGLRAANALLTMLPEGHRTQRDGQVKNQLVRPSRLSMRLDDPSEAVESSRLIPALQRHFAIVEEQPYGSILHLALHGIAHNFVAEDDLVTAQALRLCLAAEDQPLGRLGHDFTYAVCSVLAAPVPAACATGRRGPLGPGYDTTLDEAS